MREADVGRDANKDAHTHKPPSINNFMDPGYEILGLLLVA